MKNINVKNIDEIDIEKLIDDNINELPISINNEIVIMSSTEYLEILSIVSPKEAEIIQKEISEMKEEI